MTTHALALGPARRGHPADRGGLQACLSVLLALGEVLAFSYRLRHSAHARSLQ